MAHCRILQIVKDEVKEVDTVKVLPGTYPNHRECIAAIKESGEYIFLEAHVITKTNDDGQPNNG